MDRKRMFISLVPLLLGIAVGFHLIEGGDAGMIEHVLREMLGGNIPVISQTASSTASVARVIDGDTIVLDNGMHVRYIGVNTPELARDGNKTECYSNEAKRKNEEFVNGKVVTLFSDKEDKDKYGRLLRFVYADGIFVNKALIEEGYGTRVYFAPNDGYQDELRAAERKARDNMFGLWSKCR